MYSIRSRITLSIISLALLLSCQQQPSGVQHTPVNAVLKNPSAAIANANSPVYPDLIPLPNAFQPEGVTTGAGHDFYVGSVYSGAIYKGDLRTGSGSILVPGGEGRVSTGLSYDERSNLLFAAGGGTGKGYVYHATTGDLVRTYTFTQPGTFVNDVIITRTAAYFTDSFRPYLYKVPLGSAGNLPDPSAVEEVALGGDYVFVPGDFNANGIDATPNGKYLLIVNSVDGKLYKVDPSNGEATLIDLGGETVTNGDGILLNGKTLYVVRNFLNQVDVIALNPTLETGEVVNQMTDPRFRIPTTITPFGNALYVVNARFDVVQPTEPSPPDLEFEIVKFYDR